ncbi:hypothetical protein LCGC14_0142860 [marine sediment metagenome]|uniref:Uncharacterized protein n=1 Tax=marine sediment metagenome TaxID=412755 RepID=A0A0F9XIL1_9ZZZZ
MITWAEKVAFVGMVVTKQYSPMFGYKVKVSIPNGLCSFGTGDTLDEAIESAAIGMNMDWHSITRKITERKWEQIAHL